MEICIAYAEIHKDKALHDISEKLDRDCISKCLNAFWTRGKHFVTLPSSPKSKPIPSKPSPFLMSHFERYFYQKEINDL